MTIEEFRRSPVLIARIGEILADETFQLAMCTLRDSQLATDVPMEASEVASVRILSRKSGFQEALTSIVLLSLPFRPMSDPGEPDWGIDSTEPTKKS